MAFHQGGKRGQQMVTHITRVLDDKKTEKVQTNLTEFPSPEEQVSIIERVQKSNIPRGSKIPHPPGWKGSHRKTGIKAPLIPVSLDEFNTTFEDTRGKKRHLTKKQILTAKYMMAGYTFAQARLHAGYAISTVNTKTAAEDNKGLMTFLEGMNAKFIAEGITQEYVAGKMKEWFDAKKSIVNRKTGDVLAEFDDYKIQQGAFDRWKDMVTPKDEPQKGTKREIKFTEWIEQSEDGK